MPDWFKREASRKRRYQEVFGTVAGQAVIAELMNENYVFSVTTAVAGDGHVDPCHTAFNEGRRAVALQIMKILDMPLENLRRIYEEQQRQQEAE